MQRIRGTVRRRDAFDGPAPLARRYLVDAGALTRERNVYRRR